MKTVSVWTPKGGQGKSLLCINLAAAAVEIGVRSLVIDRDPQGTSMKYYKNGNLPFEVANQVPKEKPNVDIVFFDHQASDWAVPDMANVVIMPLKPARDQYATYIDAFKRAAAANKSVITVVTDGNSHRKDERETAMYLADQGAFVIPASGVFSRAAAGYRSIFDPEMNRAYKVGLRRREMIKILGAVLVGGAQ